MQFKDFIPSPEQQAIGDWIDSHINDEGRKALAISALAGTGKCVLPETLVNINGDLVTAETVWENHHGNSDDFIFDGDGFWSQPKDDLLVDSFNESTGKFEKRKITNLYRQKISENIRVIHLDDGSKIRLTFAHKLFNGLQWTNDLNVGDVVAVPSQTCHSSNHIDGDLAEFIGWLIAEGYDTKKHHSATFAFTMRDKSEILHIQDLIWKVQDKFSIKRNDLNIFYRDERNTYQMRFNSRDMRNLLEEHGYIIDLRSREKRIPKSIMSSSKQIVARFLRAYFDAEGSVSVNKMAVSLSSASIFLTKQLISLLRRFGIWARLHTKTKGATNGHNIQREYYEISISSLSLRIFNDEIGFGIPYKQDRLEKEISVEVNPNKNILPSNELLTSLNQNYGLGISAMQVSDPEYYRNNGKSLTRNAYANSVRPALLSLSSGDTFAGNQYRPTVTVSEDAINEVNVTIEKLDRLHNNDLYYATITKIDLWHYTGTVYDFEVEETHNFVAENILCHNTTTIMWLIDRLTNAGHDVKGVYCAFNRDIVNEVQPKLEGTRIQAKTFHGLALSSLKSHLKKKHHTQIPSKFWDMVDTNKYRDLVNSYIDQRDPIVQMIEDAASFTEDTTPFDVRKVFVKNALQLCHFIRVRLETWGDKSRLDWLINDYQLDDPLLTYELLEVMIEMQPIILSQGEEILKKTGVMDFDDMVYWVCKWDVRLWTNKWVFVDEAQDLSPMQRMVVSKSLDHKNGTIIIVGDTNQAIYRFTGADSDSFQRTVKWFKAETLPLSVTRRCAQIITHHAQQNVPTFTALDTAERGKFIWLDEKYFAENVRLGDMVICRVKSGLIAKAIECIAKEIPAVILGGNIGTALIDLMEKISKRDGFRWSEPEKAVSSYQFVQTQYFLKKEDESAADNVRDDCDALKVLLENSQAKSLTVFSDYVNQLFSDEDGEGKVILCTGHKSKGLEADRVFILQPEKMPLIFGNMHPEAITQEKNLQYVAWTRAKKELVYLTNKAFMEKYDNGKEIPSYVQYDFTEHRWTEDGLYLLDENDMTAIQLPSGSLQLKARPEDTEFANNLLDKNKIPSDSIVIEGNEEQGITSNTILAKAEPGQENLNITSEFDSRDITIDLVDAETPAIEPISVEEVADIGFAPTNDAKPDSPNINEPFVEVEAAESDEADKDQSIPIPEPQSGLPAIVEELSETSDEFNPVIETNQPAPDLPTIPSDMDEYQLYAWFLTLSEADRRRMRGLGIDYGPDPETGKNYLIVPKSIMTGKETQTEPKTPLALDIPTEPVAWAKFIVANKENFVVLDTETTTWATDKANCEVVQLGIADLDGNTLFNKRIKPHQARISLGASNVHGIYDDMLENEKHINHYLDEIREAIEGKYIIAYNAVFDEQLLENAFHHAKLEPIAVAGWECAMLKYAAHNPNKGMRYGRPRWWKLIEAVAQQRMTASDDAHDALVDVIMTVDLIQSMAQDSEYRWENHKGFKPEDIVKVKASGAHFEIIKTMPNGDLNMKDVKDSTRHTMNASMIDLVTAVEDRPTLPEPVADTVKASVPKTKEPQTELPSEMSKRPSFKTGETVFTRTNRKGIVVSHNDRYVKVDINGRITDHKPESLSYQPEPKTKSAKLEITPVPNQPKSPQLATQELENLMKTLESREQALEFMELLQEVIDVVHPA